MPIEKKNYSWQNFRISMIKMVLQSNMQYYIYTKKIVVEQRWKTIIIIQNFFLIDSRLFLEFWAKAIDIASYLQICLQFKNQIKELIPKKNWTKKKKNINYIKVFSNIVSIVIPKEKKHKFDIYKN